MKVLLILALCAFNFSAFANKDKSKTEPKALQGINNPFGLIYRAPIKVGKKLYILASSGKLFSSDLDFSNPKELMQTENKTFSGILRDKNIIYFGDGIHHDNVSFFYAFDTKKNKIVFKTKVKGHIEKFPIKYKKNIIFSAGIGGLIAINKKGEVQWRLTRDKTAKVHIDSTPILRNSTLYVTSIYDHKALLCVDADHGKITCSVPTKVGIKNDLIPYGRNLVAIGTTANTQTKDYKTPSVLKVFNTKSKSFTKNLDLRGFNFFTNKTNDKMLNLATSSGDIIRVEIPSLKVHYLDLFPEPFQSSAFKMDDNDCFFSTMGRLSCYDEKHKRVHTNRDNKRAAIGDIIQIGEEIYIPTRVGFLKLKNKL